MSSDAHRHSMIVTACGDDAIRICGGQVEDLRALGCKIRAHGGFEEVVDGISSLTVQFDPLKISRSKAETELSAITEHPISTKVDDTGRFELEIVFGGELGPDLGHVAQALGRSEDEIVEELCSLNLNVDMLGFTPGFAYISGVPESLNVSRRATPRQRVHAGSVGLANGRLGTYALEGPGGWQIIGRARTKLFDTTADPPFLIRPGMELKLISVDTL